MVAIFSRVQPPGWTRCSIAALLAHPRALALLVVWAVGAVLLAVLRPVRKHDPVLMDREAAGMMLALLVIPLATPALAAFGVQAHVYPKKRQFLQYTTTSPIMQQRLGVADPPGSGG